jgi:aspartyl-tRNA synthetase
VKKKEKRFGFMINAFRYGALMAMCLRFRSDWWHYLPMQNIREGYRLPEKFQWP